MGSMRSMRAVRLRILQIIGARRAGGVGDEQHVKLGALNGLRRLDPTLDVLSAIISGARKAPAGHVIIAIARQKQSELHLAFGFLI